MLQQHSAFRRGDGQQQLEIFTIGQRMFQRSSAVISLVGLRVDRNCICFKDGSNTAFIENVKQIGHQTVADVDHGVQPNRFVQLQRFFDAGAKCQMAARQTGRSS